jgi:hypothetical protein
MQIRPTPGYRDLFGGTARLEDLLEGISSTTVIKVVSWLNAQFLSIATPVDRDREIRGTLTRNLPDSDIIKLGQRLSRSAGANASVFHSLYLSYFLQYELTHFRHLPERDLTPAEELRIFKAYLVVVDMYSQQTVIPQTDISLADEDYFTQRTWPMLFKQHEFNRNVDAILMLTRLYLLMDTLEKSKHASFVTNYCNRFGLQDGFHLVRMFLSVIHVSTRFNDGKSRVHRIENTPKEIRLLLDTITHPVTSERGSWVPLSLKSLKQHPLYKSAEDEYHILNWNFFYRSVYEAILRDFYATSGISTLMKSPVDFKQWVGFEVTEKRLFRGIMSMMCKDNSELLTFPAEGEDGMPDAYVRNGRYVIIIECKDTDVSEVNQSDFEYSAFLAELEKKHVENEKGKPKTVQQLARCARRIKEGRFPSSVYATHRAKDLWVLPMLVCDGYLYTAPGINEILNRRYESVLTTKTGRLTVITLEYLFRKMADFRSEGLSESLLNYSRECKRRKKQFKSSPTVEAAMSAFPSMEEAVRVRQSPYKAQTGFIEEFYSKLGLAYGREATGDVF